VVWILARQVQVGRVKPRLLWLVPLLLAFFGIRSLPSSTWHVPADLGLLAVSAVISIGLGIWRGQTIRVWRDADGTWWRQGSALTGGSLRSPGDGRRSILRSRTRGDRVLVRRRQGPPPDAARRSLSSS
jgi:hypothetical protein